MSPGPVSLIVLDFLNYRCRCSGEMPAFGVDLVALVDLCSKYMQTYIGTSGSAQHFCSSLFDSDIEQQVELTMIELVSCIKSRLCLIPTLERLDPKDLRNNKQQIIRYIIEGYVHLF